MISYGFSLRIDVPDGFKITLSPKAGPDVVLEQLEEGFVFGDNDEVLRAAKVIVSS